LKNPAAKITFLALCGMGVSWRFVMTERYDLRFFNKPKVNKTPINIENGAR
jgi:hypothetical protein